MKTSPSPSHALRFESIALSILFLFAVLEATSKGQEDLHQLVGLRT
jgi:hypothetical protein